MDALIQAANDSITVLDVVFIYVYVFSEWQEVISLLYIRLCTINVQNIVLTLISESITTTPIDAICQILE
jgi:hypothetical protein